MVFAAAKALKDEPPYPASRLIAAQQTGLLSLLVLIHRRFIRMISMRMATVVMPKQMHQGTQQQNQVRQGLGHVHEMFPDHIEQADDQQHAQDNAWLALPKRRKRFTRIIQHHALLLNGWQSKGPSQLDPLAEYGKQWPSFHHWHVHH
jgi:hypothetical protein